METVFNLVNVQIATDLIHEVSLGLYLESKACSMAIFALSRKQIQVEVTQQLIRFFVIHCKLEKTHTNSIRI